MKNELDLEDEIKEFAKETAIKLLRKSDAKCIVTFREQDYLAAAFSTFNSTGEIIVKVKICPWIKQGLAIQGGIPDPNSKIKTASAIFEKQCSMQEFVAKLVTMVFFNIYNLLPEVDE